MGKDTFTKIFETGPNETIIIGIDHGYAAMKTARFSFLTGLVEYSYEPYKSECAGIRQEVLCSVDGKAREIIQREAGAYMSITCCLPSRKAAWISRQCQPSFGVADGGSVPSYLSGRFGGYDPLRDPGRTAKHPHFIKIIIIFSILNRKSSVFSCRNL